MLAACAHTAPRDSSPKVPAGWPLLAPATLGTDRAVTQVLRAAFADREMTFNCVVKVDHELLTVVALSAIGARLFTLKFDGSEPHVLPATALPAPFRPEGLLNDLQLAFWDLAKLQAAFAGTSWQVTEPFASTRRLKHAGRLVAEVHYASADPWSGRLWLANFAFGYSLSVDTRAVQEP